MDSKYPASPNSPHSQLITFVPDRPGHDRRYAMDIRKIEKELGWQPAENLETGLVKTVDWYLDNLGWIEKILDRSEFKDWIETNYEKR